MGCALPFNLGGIVEGMELVSQPQQEAVVVVDRAEEALENDWVGKSLTAVTLDSKGITPEAVTRHPR